MPCSPPVLSQNNFAFILYSVPSIKLIEYCGFSCNFIHSLLSSSNIDAADEDINTESDRYSLSENVCTVAAVSIPYDPPKADQYVSITESALK